MRNEWHPLYVLRVQVSFTLFLHCPKEELKKRLLERGETSGRADDNVETVLKRFDTFEKESLPVVEQLELLGMVSRFRRVIPGTSALTTNNSISDQTSGRAQGVMRGTVHKHTLSLLEVFGRGNVGLRLTMRGLKLHE